ncbi:MAG: methyltransferase domain-containing protein [Alphaproteobacteria bacterium]|nr:methyltransferase domain-containing protein [Alphaproteobacteria bacterium SS10]
MSDETKAGSAKGDVAAIIRAAFREGWMARHQLREPDENDVENDWIISEARKAGTSEFKAVTPELVRDCYRALLKREPENDDVVAARVAGTSSVSDLLESFRRSPELLHRAYIEYLRRHSPALKPKPRFDLDIAPDQFNRLFERVVTQWSDLGQAEPYWSVLTDEKYKSDAIDEEVRQRFYDTGKDLERELRQLHARNDVAFQGGVCLELGAGVGRLTTTLAKMFDRVIAVDISPGNLEICRKHLEKNNIDNVDFKIISNPEQIGELENFDYFYSLMVLQHNPPPIQEYILDIIFRNLNEGGFVNFQLPTSTPEYQFDIEAYLSSSRQVMDMHDLPMSRVFRLFQRHEILPIDVIMDSHTGTFGSHSFFGQKRSGS